MTATLAALVRQAAERLRERLGPEQNALLDAEVIARHVLGWDRAQWIAGSRAAPPPDFAAAFEAAMTRRARGEPVAYITGTREFWGLDFEVTPDVLIPRPETELLVEQALKVVGGGVVADVGTGSGCIAVAIAHSRPFVHVIATDVSPAALGVARRNAARHGVAVRIEFVHTAALDGVGDVDLVVSNPPYIAADDSTVSPDVREHEPHTALFSGDDGLDMIRALLADVARRDPVPPCIFEFGGSEAAVREAVGASGLRLTQVIPDLAGVPRIAVVER
ncbi:MAG: peptide chain release factor N(5)-glutamine methyltransferase [Vicinamibacterales bacterium]